MCKRLHTCSLDVKSATSPLFTAFKYLRRKSYNCLNLFHSFRSCMSVILLRTLSLTFCLTNSSRKHPIAPASKSSLIRILFLLICSTQHTQNKRIRAGGQICLAGFLAARYKKNVKYQCKCMTRDYVYILQSPRTRLVS